MITTIVLNISNTFVSIFSQLFFSFMNNFCIAPCLFSTTKLLRDSNKNLEHLFCGYPIGYIFGVHSQCKSKTFWVDLDGMACCCAYPSVGVVHMWVVCM